MKLRINFDEKEILILDQVNLEDFYNNIRKMFPDTYKEFKVIQENNIVYVPTYQRVWPYDWTQPLITWTTSTAGTKDQPSTFTSGTHFVNIGDN